MQDARAIRINRSRCHAGRSGHPHQQEQVSCRTGRVVATTGRVVHIDTRRCYARQTQTST
jgi:hypothetical protein